MFLGTNSRKRTMKNTGVALSVLLLTAGTLRAGLGDVSYVPCEPGKGLQNLSLPASNREFGKPGPDSGTVNPDAIVATLRSGAILVAVDSKTPDAESPDVVRFDFSGKGKFNDDHVVPLRLTSPGGRAQDFRFGPTTLEVQRERETLPVTVEGRYYKSGTNRYLWLRLGLAAQATCRFADKTYPVRLMDGDSNLRVDDSGKPMKYRSWTVGLTPGDTIAVDLGDGEFGESVRQAFYGQPILVNGTWYEVKLSPDRKKITTKALDLKTGQIKIGHDNYTLKLVGEKHSLCLSGAKDAVSVPEDRYTLIEYVEALPNAPQGAGLWCGRRAAYTGKAKVFEVVGGKVTELTIGSPLTASAQVSQRGTTVRLSLNLVDAAGMAVDNLVIAPKGTPPAPTLKIRDETGKMVHKGTMGYG
jgi:hypothetical protein